MQKTERNLMLCAMFFVVALVISNVMAGKVIQTGIPFMGATITIPCAVIAYPVTFLMTDVIGELWGRKEANLVVRSGFACQCFATALLLVGGALPGTDAQTAAAYQTTLGTSWIFFIASMTAYLLSQSWDVFFFHKIRGAFVREGGKGVGWRWVWNNASTMTAQVIDTVVFIGIAFGLGFGWLFDPSMQATLVAMMVGQYVIKLVIAAVDTPFFYLLTRGEGEKTTAVATAA